MRFMAAVLVTSARCSRGPTVAAGAETPDTEDAEDTAIRDQRQSRARGPRCSSGSLMAGYIRSMLL